MFGATVVDLPTSALLELGPYPQAAVFVPEPKLVLHTRRRVVTLHTTQARVQLNRLPAQLASGVFIQS